MNRTYYELVSEIKDAVRNRAKSIPLFQKKGSGAIRITTIPHCAFAQSWINGGNIDIPLEYDDNIIYEHVFPIVKGGEFVADFSNDKIRKRVDCYAYSAMKTAYCHYLNREFGRKTSEYTLTTDKDITEQNGFGTCQGTVCATIMKISRLDILFEYFPFFDLYISVSGANPEEDELCALAGIEVLDTFDIELFIDDGGDDEDYGE